ncbi:hypothetical protein [Paraflavitalea pollutisoli]|uniref:hypothetical protein n=1 Tax=Paraflavitalea pollutisoli TaxID=3034143 RepID=UPI0023EE14F3|nr:hypothetical protein [Paraflavitalea sp. H1-2-19X]
MQPLSNMHNVQRAKLLCSLIPEEIPAFLEALQTYASQITRDPQAVRASFEQNPNPILGAGDWIAMAEEVQEALGKHRQQMPAKSALFADQLFDGLLALFTAHCINEYSATLPADNKFRQAATLLFY